MKRELERMMTPAAVRRGRGSLAAGLAGVWLGCLGLAWAEETVPPATPTVPAAASGAATNTPATVEALPLMIPDATWQRLALTADQQAQLQALQAGLYSDQLAVIRSLAPQAEPLRVALAAARQTEGQEELVAKLKGQILELTWPLVVRYDRFVCEAGWMLDAVQRAELAKVAKEIVTEKRLAALAAKLGLDGGVQVPAAISAALGPLEAILPEQDDDDDGLPTVWELQHGLNPLESSDAGVDTDGDGLVNYTEYLLDSDPQDPDDTDSLPEDWKQKLAQRVHEPVDPNANKDPKNKDDKSKTSSKGSFGGGSSVSTTGGSGSARINVQIISPASGSTVK